MRAFDFIVTVALGSTLAIVLLSKNVSLADGVLALGLLIFLQYVLAATAVRSKAFSTFISSEPSLVFFDGRFLKKAFLKGRVTEAEVRSALRSQGIANLEEVHAVVMESNGQFCVVNTGSLTDPGSSIFSWSEQ